MATGLPTSWTVEVEFTAGVWTDLASRVNQNLVIRRGRSDAASDSQPGTLTVTVENTTGDLTPDNPLGAFYPNLVEGKRIRVRVTKGATSTRFLGRITSIVPQYPTVPGQGTTAITAVDALGDLAGIEKLLPAHTALAAATGPIYPLTDTSINGGASSLDGSLPKMTPAYVTSAGSFDFASDSSFSSDAAPCLAMTAGARLWHASPAFATAGARWNHAALFLLPSGASGEVFALSVGKRTAATALPNLVSVTWDGVSSVSVAGATVTGVTPGWHYIGISWAPASVLVLTVDLATATDSGAGYSGVSYTCLSVGGTIPLSVRDLICAPGGSPDATVIAQALSSGLTLDQDATDLGTVANITALGLGAILWTTSTTRAATYLGSGGRGALDVLLDLARSESGIVYHDYATSTIKLLAGVDSHPTAVSLTVDAAADAIDGPQLSRSNVSKAASVTAKSPVSSITVTDPSMVGGTAEVATLLADPNDLYAAASNGLSRGRDQKLRLRSFTADLVTATNDLYASLFALNLGGRVRYAVGAASTYFGVTYFDGYAEGLTETIGPETYSVDFDLSPADAPREARWDTARWAFGDGVCTGTSGTAVGSTGTGTLVLTWTGGGALSTSAGDYPLDLDWNGERVTVTAAPAGSASPQTLTITARGVAPTVARVHAAGEAVDLWDAGRWAF